MTTYDRQTFFDAISPLFGGTLTQQQVDGMGFKLSVWERHHGDCDPRWLAYALATSMHETAATMWPLEEYGHGEGQPYGEIVEETGQAYYGRGDVQLTWDYNYKGATARLGLGGDDDLYWHPDRALDPSISADVMFLGMIEGWFRDAHMLDDYFSDDEDDPFNAREIINGDKDTVPDWSGGVSIGNIIAGYHDSFLSALLEATQAVVPEPEGPAFTIDISVPKGFIIRINGQEITAP